MPPPTGSPATAIKLSREGAPLGMFREVSGLDSEQEVIEHREMDAHGNPVIQRLPGATKWPDVTLTRALVAGDELWRWRRSVVTGDFAHARADCTIEVIDQAGQSVAAFHLKQAWPANYRVSLSPAGGDGAAEKLVLAHQGFAR
jgi:phage tail-like protein